ncbi:hypothetical protein GUJ93_ZPchr0009g1256 [Zizania palustris]|uniref:25S rRNA (uridine-N(3))-methyltransferase BMT5-like domain-containing protein n=1 Tax=Zizania palustris TaxID=103762 RepID=A0A8J5R2M9_ZIZPA|nr:hypothetical protein GUJ93_ZPchr0009g1256 [Zizania palustris]
MVAGKEMVPAAEGETMDVVVDGEVEALHGIPVTDDGNDEAPVAEVVNAIAIDGEEVAPAGEGNTVTAKVAVKEVVPAAEGETMDAVANGEVEALQGISVTDDGNKEAPVAEGVNVIAVYGEEAAPEGEGETVAAKVAGKEVTLEAEGETVDAVVDGEVEPLPLPSSDRQFVARTLMEVASLSPEDANVASTVVTGGGGVDKAPLEVEVPAIAVNGEEAVPSGEGDTLTAKVAVKGLTRSRRRCVKWLMHYSSAQSILTVGDGDFSFSLALGTAFGSGENLVATSLDSYVHVSHKSGWPYDSWDIEQLATESSLAMVEQVYFQKEDYPGYNNKRGDGSRSDKHFPLGLCYTYKFISSLEL